MLCDTCTNRRYCENEERMMCIANDYDRYDDDSIEYFLDDADMSGTYDQEIDSVKAVFRCIMLGNPMDRGTKTVYDCCTAVVSIIDRELGNMMFNNILTAAGTCHA